MGVCSESMTVGDTICASCVCVACVDDECESESDDVRSAYVGDDSACVGVMCVNVGCMCVCACTLIVRV